MNISTNKFVSIAGASRDFSRVPQLVDKGGPGMIQKNDVPRYMVVEFQIAEPEEVVADEDVSAVSQRLIAKNRASYEQLADERPDKETASHTPQTADRRDRWR